ncbi:MAG: hypothetical protein ACRCUA_04840 [Fusobacteriaceae bacterium]
MIKIIKKNILLFVFLFNLTFSEQIIFRTSVSPGRIFIDSKGGNASLTLNNISEDILEIIVSLENSKNENIKFFPKKFILSPKESQIIRLQTKKDFFNLKDEEKILYITEYSPLVVINNRKFRPRHGVTIKQK